MSEWVLRRFSARHAKPRITRTETVRVKVYVLAIGRHGNSVSTRTDTVGVFRPLGRYLDST